MKIKYIGRHRNGVTIPAAGDLFVGYGDTADVADEVAEGLLRQASEWKASRKSATPNPPDSAEADDPTTEGDES